MLYSNRKQIKGSSSKYVTYWYKMLCLVTFVKYQAAIELLSTTPVNQLLQSALTISTW